MKLILESTTKIVELKTKDGIVPARIWEGTTASGITVHAFIARVAIDGNETRTEEFERELQEQRPPSAEALTAYPLRMIL